MTNAEFEVARATLNAACEDILLRKGADYSGQGDRLQNFKDVAVACGVDPLQAWFIFFYKHVSALATYVRTRQLSSEPLPERFKDARNYSDLGYALSQESDNLGRRAP